MKQEWSAQWKASVQPRKQRKYRVNAPLHIKRTFMHAHLAKDLRKKYARRQISLRKDDKVKIMNGDFKGKEGKVSEIDMKSGRVFVEGIDRVKKDGSKARIPLQVSNLMITALGKEDKRIKKQEAKKAEKKTEEKSKAKKQ